MSSLFKEISVVMAVEWMFLQNLEYVLLAFWQGVGFKRKFFFGMFAQQFGLLQQQLNQSKIRQDFIMVNH